MRAAAPTSQQEAADALREIIDANHAISVHRVFYQMELIKNELKTKILFLLYSQNFY